MMTVRHTISSPSHPNIRRLLVPFLLLSMMSLASWASAGEFDFLTEYQGKAKATVTVANQPKTLLHTADAASYKRHLERLRDSLLKQPVFNPPKGVEVIGYFRPNDSLPKNTRLPVPGFGYLRFHFYHRDPKTGKPIRICCTTDEIYVSINDPGKGFTPYTEFKFQTPAFYEPKQTGNVAGYPVYRMEGGDEMLLLNRSRVPMWIPVTREEYVTAALAYWEKLAAENPPEDTITPQIVSRHRAALAAMSPEERKMQARTQRWDAFEPSLAPVGSDEGQALVRVNPAWYDPKLPRSAFQLITLRFSYSGTMNPDTPGPTQHGDIAPYRVWQALHTSDWQEISTVLTGKQRR